MKQHFHRRGYFLIQLIYNSDQFKNDDEKRLVGHFSGDDNWAWLRSNRKCLARPHTSSHCSDKDRQGVRKCLYNKELDLGIIGCCRQLYEEASQILWSTNTFSFYDTITLRRFMEDRKLFQKRLVKRLRLMMNWAFELHRAWNSALNIKEFGRQLPYSYLTLTISFAFGRVSRCEIQCTGRATKRVCTARAPAKERRILFILDLAVGSKIVPPLRVADRMRVRS